MSTSFPGPGHVYDLIVVGAGISGAEAAALSARAGLDVLLVTTSLDTVYNLLGDGVTLAPPAGTLMAEVHETVADADGFVGNWAFHRGAKGALEHLPKLHLLQSSVSSLLIEGGAVEGVSTWEGVDRVSSRVALCVGSFLEARLRVGNLIEEAGRLSEMAYDDLYENLAALGFGFEALELHASSVDPPYTVACRRFAAGEWDPSSFRLSRLDGLYGAGVCVSGYLTYEEAAAQGRALADSLTAQSDTAQSGRDSV